MANVGAKEGIGERQRCQEADDEMCKLLLILEATGGRGKLLRMGA